MVIKAIFSDFDGVFTDNSVLIDEEGKEYVKCCRSDGLGIEKIKEQGIYFCIVSSEVVPLAKRRALKHNVDCYTGVKDKGKFIRNVQEKRSIKREECAFIGNDINDLGAFGEVGLKIAVADSYEPLLSEADHILKCNGGHGALRETCEYIIDIENRT